MQWDRTLPEDIEKTRTAMGEGWSLVGSSLGETLTVIAIATLVGIGFLIARRWASVLLLATALLVEVSVFVTTTLLVPRDRPNVEQLDVSPPTSSYPSGHTAAATALALTLAVLVGWNTRSTVVRWFAWILAVLVGPIVAVSRLYRGMHHPTDVAVGFFIGIASVVLAILAVRAWVGSTAPRHRVRESVELEKSAS
jgi:undecaprenyl-diphosphatase